MIRIILDVSNLTSHSEKWVRTGIQEVIYQTLKSVIELRVEFPEAEIILLPFLPRRMQDSLNSETLLPYFDTPKWILEEIEASFNLSSKEIWGFDLKAENYALTREEILQLLESADYFHLQSLANFGPVRDVLSLKKFSATFYDLGPILFPEFTAPGIAAWFSQSYLPALAQMDQIYAISQNSALEFKTHHPHFGGKIFDLRLPATALKTSQRPAQESILLSIASMEPRKNLDAVLDGFETFLALHPSSPLKLVLAGATGWRNETVYHRIRKSWIADRIQIVGFTSEEKLAELILSAQAVILLAHHEGYGLPIAQALAAGIPAITTLGSSLPEASQGEAVFVDPSDPVSIAAGIALIQSPDFKKPARPHENWNTYTKSLLQSIFS